MIPASEARREKSHTEARYSVSSPMPFPSALWRDTLTLWTPWAARTASPRSPSSVPLVVRHVRKPRSAAMARSSPNRGCSRGSPMTWRYRYFTCPRSFSASSQNRSGGMKSFSRPVPGQKEHRRLHTLVISI